MGADRLAGRYELGTVIGRGRSSVYAACDTRLRRKVAVKRVAVATGPDDVDDPRSRTLREAQAAARMASSHVVGVYDVVEEADAVWLVMELVEAPSLDAIVRERGPLPHALAAAIGLGVVDALLAAHAVGVLHRDVKPANVLVGLGEELDVKLADFGVASLRDESSMTLPGLVVGSPSYMAPEQAAGEAVGPEADLWALGGLLYFAVEGVPPYARGSALATATAVVHAEPRPHHHPGMLTPLIDALLVKNPGRRPDAVAVRGALHAIAETWTGSDWSPATTQVTAVVVPTGEPTVVRRPPSDPGDRALLRKAAPKPHRRRVALVAVAAVVLLGGAASQVFGLGTSPTPTGPPAADAQTTSVPAAGAAEPSTTAVPHTSRRYATPTTTAAPATSAPDQPADSSTTAAPTTAPATPTTTTTPDGPNTTSGPPDTPAPTTTATTAPPPVATTPPTTGQSGG